MSTGPYQQPRQDANGFAIAALIVGIFALVPLAVIFGFVALSQIKSDGGRGRGMAIAGIALSAVWTVVGVVAVILLVDTFVGRDGDGRVTSAGAIFESDIRAGDCLNEPVEDDPLLDAVPCEDPHDAEVFARFTLEGTEFPGLDNVARRADAGCRHRFEDRYPPRLAALQDDMSYFSPDSVDWSFRDRYVLCFANFDPRRSGSLEPR